MDSARHAMPAVKNDIRTVASRNDSAYATISSIRQPEGNRRRSTHPNHFATRLRLKNFHTGAGVSPRRSDRSLAHSVTTFFAARISSRPTSRVARLVVDWNSISARDGSGMKSARRQASIILHLDFQSQPLKCEERIKRVFAVPQLHVFIVSGGVNSEPSMLDFRCMYRNAIIDECLEEISHEGIPERTATHPRFLPELHAPPVKPFKDDSRPGSRERNQTNKLALDVVVCWLTASYVMDKPVSIDDETLRLGIRIYIRTPVALRPF